MDLDEFRNTHMGDAVVHTIEIDPAVKTFIEVRSGDQVFVLSPMALTDHTCLDVHPFLAGKDAVAGVFGMTNGQRWHFPDTGRTSHGWEAANLISVLVGQQITYSPTGEANTFAVDVNGRRLGSVRKTKNEWEARLLDDTVVGTSRSRNAGGQLLADR